MLITLPLTLERPMKPETPQVRLYTFLRDSKGSQGRRRHVVRLCNAERPPEVFYGSRNVLGAARATLWSAKRNREKYSITSGPSDTSEPASQNMARSIGGFLVGSGGICQLNEALSTRPDLFAPLVS